MGDDRPWGSGATARPGYEQHGTATIFEVRGEESDEWLVLDGKRHPPRVICRCHGWNAPKNAALIVAALEAHNSELYSKFPLDGSVRLNEQSAVNPACHQARFNLRLHPSLQPESPGHGTGLGGDSPLERMLYHQKPSF